MSRIEISLPDWIERYLASYPTCLRDPDAQMALVIGLASANVHHATGGPFGAALFALDDGRCLGVGVNQVVHSHCSLAHAEMLALACAQQQLGDYDLGRAVRGGCVLLSSAEPCAMCTGALPWSGIRRLIYGARDADVRAIGFDEGHKPVDWREDYAQHGIEVIGDLGRADAVAVLREYASTGGELYDPGAASRS